MKVIQAGEGAPPANPLDALAAQADQAASPPPPADGEAAPGEDAKPPAKLSNEQCLMMVIEMVRETLCKIAKVESPKSTMSNEVMQPVVDSWGEVLSKYGIDLSAAAGDYIVEIKAAILTVPVLLAIRSGLQAEVKASKVTTVDAAPAAGTVLQAVAVDG